MSYSASQLTVPSGFPELLQGLAREVLRNQPGDIVAFAHEHFAKLMQDRQNSEEALEKAQMIEKETTVLTPNADAIVPEKVENQEEEEEELPNLNDFNNSDVHAVTKIQSGFRGMQARKHVKELKEQQEKEVEEVEELPELDSFDSREVNAITKIQSGFRGMQARKQVDGMKKEKEEEAVSTLAVEEEEDLPNLNEFNNDEVNAITKIQSGFRGMQARKQVEEMKNNRNEEEVDEEKTEQNVDNQPQEAEEELPKLEEFNDQEVNAITKIQSGFRGMKARKEVDEMKKDKEIEQVNNQASQEVSSPITSGPDDEVPELLDSVRPMTAQTNAEHVEIPESARTVTEE